jgi:hypothetical protein
MPPVCGKGRVFFLVFPIAEGRLLFMPDCCGKPAVKANEHGQRKKRSFMTSRMYRPEITYFRA